MNISIIAAIANDNAIGKNNDLLVYISADLKRFKQLTTGHPIIMGRKTFESLPNGALPNRKNIILTKQKNYKANNCEVVHSIEDAILSCNDSNEAFIIGGASVYNLFMPKSNKLYITKIHKSFEKADAFFPRLNLNEWHLDNEEGVYTDKKTNIKYSYMDYTRKQ
ncbi:MAG: dihydrofolate reductase [Marinilabiliaceae bacterium]|nr:dihydrofolate reductase [Marinilabiliaceae bacterium]